MRKCMIIGAGEFTGFNPNFTAEYIIAADGGYDHLNKHKLNPDLVVGDFDSVKKTPVNVEIIRHPSEKDESDLELAVEAAITRGFDCFYIYGALGKRLDHTLASIAVLISISQKGMTGYLIGDDEIITAVTDSLITLGTQNSGVVSVFATGEAASGVNLKGLKYPLSNAVLTCGSTRGLSNEFIGVEAVIEVRNGTLIVITS